ncbi:sensor histidine kinase [Aquabacterium sp. OR-4]|uniref:sensor histidine kinase n=1 Tax=Aquabacterium sp. OR-4 TaxID=2978127 RepID=UPI0021B1D6B0|nr:ATP-binding protein [Aquabacterium sp. OR-4]MDT7836672.1 ATP-binding protein [Aquabacterium sp. OR-4]
MTPDISPSSATLVVGLLYAVVALTVWALLLHRHPRVPLALWSLGAAAAGLALSLLGLRDQIPDWIAMTGAFALAFGSFPLRVMALRLDIGSPPRIAWAVGAWLLMVAGYQMATMWLSPADRSLYAQAMIALGTGVLARQAFLAATVARSRNGLALAWVETALTVALSLRMGGVMLGWLPVRPPGMTWDFALVLLVALAAALYGNLGYLGMVLDKLRRAEYRARQGQMAEAARRAAAEQTAAELRDLLAQRDQLAAERDQLLRVLAHEIRQPLHNASGALQAAALLVQAPTPADTRQLSERLLRAQSVLGDVRSVLDNTLAAALMLTRRDPLVVQDVDLHLLVHLVLGDLPESQRARTQVDWQTPLRSAELEPGLVRLALRNLMRNAFEHGGAEVKVTLRIEEQDNPPAMVLVVADNGQGRLAVLLEAGAPPAPPDTTPTPSSTLPRRGLGLFIVRRVMALHHGRLVLSANPPHGLQARLVFPDPSDTPA